MRYAEHCLTEQARRLGVEQPLRTMYMIGYVTADVTVVIRRRKKFDHLLMSCNVIVSQLSVFKFLECLLSEQT